MTVKRKKFSLGVRVKPTDQATVDNGDISLNSGDNKLKVRTDGTEHSVLTEAQTQTITNKTIDADNNTISNLETDNLKAGVLITDISFATSNTEIPSALAVKTALEGQDDAGEIAVDDTNFVQLTGTEAQSVLESADTLIDGLNTSIGTINTDISNLETLVGSPNATDLGTFTGTTIPDTSTVKGALQALETPLETVSGKVDDLVTLSGVAANAENLGTFTGVTIADSSTVKAALQALETELETRVDGAGAATDNAVTRFDGTSGSLLQNSVVTIDDVGVVAGITQLNVDNLRADGNTISSTDVDGNIIISPNGDGLSQVKNIVTTGSVYTTESTDSSTTGANATVSTLGTKVIRLTNASLTSISMITPDAILNQEITLVNHTGNTITINDNTGATAADRILTGQKGSIDLEDEASLNLVYDGTESRWLVVGGTGGGAGVSSTLMSDFEKLTPVTSNVVAALELTTKLPIEDNKKSIKATFSSSNGYIRYEAPASADLDGVQGLVTLWIKTSVENLTVVATKDTVAQNNGLQVTANNKWRQYEIPVVLGDADYGFEVRASGAVSGDVFIDEAFVKVESVIRELGAAHFVGKIHLANNCQYTTTSATFTHLLDTDSTCSASSIEGSISLPSNTNRAGVKITNFRTDGYYKIFYQGLLYKDAAAGVCSYAVSKTSSYTDGGYVQIYSPSVNGNQSTLSNDIRFTSSDTGEAFFISKNAASTICRLYGQSSDTGSISVHFFPDSTSTVVTQETELTVKTANEFSVLADSSTNPAISGDIFDIINGNCTETDATYKTKTCTYNAGIFNEIPLVKVVAYTGSLAHKAQCSVSLLSLGSFSYTCNNDATPTSYGAVITITKQLSDVNKSATIIGKFENINSDKISKVNYTGTSNTAYNTANDMPFSTKVNDDLNEWNGTKFTRTKEGIGYYLVTGSMIYTTSTTRRPDLFKNNSFLQTCGDSVNYDSHNISCIVSLNINEYFSIRSNTGTLINSAAYHYLNIIEFPTYEAIVANLSNQKTKCEIKKVSANITTSGVAGDIGFSNLVIGKKYSLSSRAEMITYITASDDVVLNFTNNATTVLYLETNQSSGVAGMGINFGNRNDLFTAAATTITATVTISGTGILAAGTYATLCELPDTYVETTEF